MEGGVGVSVMEASCFFSFLCLKKGENKVSQTNKPPEVLTDRLFCWRIPTKSHHLTGLTWEVYYRGSIERLHLGEGGGKKRVEEGLAFYKGL